MGIAENKQIVLNFYEAGALDQDATSSLAPSVVGLMVANEYRRRGVASRLLKAATRLAQDLGCNHVYINTTVLGDQLLRSGWRRIGDARFLDDEQGSVYVIDLPAPK